MSITLDYLAIRDSNITLTGTATANNSIDYGNNTNWLFTGTTGGTVKCNYLSIQDSGATPAVGVWYAYNSVNVSNNTGWNFNTVLYEAYCYDSMVSNSREQVGAVYYVAETSGSSVADLSTIQLNYAATAIENIFVADMSGVKAIFAPGIVENFNILDIGITQTNFNSAIVESSALADSESAVRVHFSSTTNPITVASTQATTAIFSGVAIENFNPLDISSPQTNFNASEVESILSGDKAVSYGWFKVNDAQNANWVVINNNQVIS